MRKIYIYILFLFISSFLTAKDWKVIDLATAKKVIEEIEKHKIILLWCDCCESNDFEYITVDQVLMKPHENTDKFTISIVGAVEGKGVIMNSVDVSHIFINYKTKALNLANFLELKPLKLCNYSMDFKKEYTQTKPVVVLDNNEHDNYEFEDNKKQIIFEEVSPDDYYKENSRFLSNEIYFLIYEDTKYVSTKPFIFKDEKSMKNDLTLHIGKDSDGSAIISLRKKYSNTFTKNNILYDKISIFLENGEIIIPDDLNIRGTTSQESFKIYFLDDKLVSKLKRHNIIKIKYFITPETHIELNEKEATIVGWEKTTNEISYIF